MSEQPKFNVEKELTEILANRDSIRNPKKNRGENPEEVDRLKSDIIFCKKDEEKETLDKIVKRIEDFPELKEGIVFKIDLVMQEYRDELKKDISDQRKKLLSSKIYALLKLKALFFEKYPDQREKNVESRGEKDFKLKVEFLLVICAKDNEDYIVHEFEKLFKKYPQLKYIVEGLIETRIKEMKDQLGNDKKDIAEVFNFPPKITALDRLLKHFFPKR
jgi:hypothetical protein